MFQDSADRHSRSSSPSQQPNDSKANTTESSESLEKKSLSESKNENSSLHDAAVEETDESAYPHGIRLAVIIAALAMNVFIVALSNTIIATAIPTIASAFEAFDDIAWYSSSELITVGDIPWRDKTNTHRLTGINQATGFQLPFGAAYSHLNTKWTFLSSTVIYLIGSAICGAAPSSTVLIVGRAIAGIGNAGVLGGAFILIARNTPLRLRSAFTGVIGGVYSLASVTGPIIGMCRHHLARSN